MRASHILALLSLFVIACGGSGSGGYLSKNAEATAAEAPAGGAFEMRDEAAPGPPSVPADRKIIRTGELRFEVADLDAARVTLLDRVGVAGGYVEGDDRSDWGNALALTLRVRVPAEKFDAFVKGLDGLGELQSQSINAQDVTAEWVDVEARLKAKKEVEARFLEIVKQAKTVTEVLEVERELGNVRAEIESMEARMKALRDQVAMSTLTITCTKPQASSDKFTPHVGVALKEGWNNLLRFLVGLLYIWPFTLAFVILLAWWVRRRKRRRGAKA